MLDDMFQKSLTPFTGRQIDPVFLGKLLDFIIDMLNDCKERNSPSEIEAIARRSSGFTIRIAKRRLRRKIGRVKFHDMGDKWADSMLGEIQASPEGTIAEAVESML